MFLLLFLLWWRGSGARGVFTSGVLSRRQGYWVYRQPGRTRFLHLQQAWPSSLWMTLRFQSESAESMSAFEITVYKSGLKPKAWQHLCLQVAQDLQFPNSGGQLDRT